MSIEAKNGQNLHFAEPVDHDKHMRYGSSTPTKVWFDKIMEEVMEAHEAATLNDSTDEYEHQLAMELQDIITVCTTYMANGLGLSFADRQRVCKKINKKNRERGYLAE